MNVTLISKSQSLVEGVNTEELTAYVARLGQVKDNPERLLKYLIKNKHWSPFQHTYFGFKIETSRAIARQFIRHQSFDFQEVSQRYEKDIMGFEPIELRREALKNRQSSEEVFNPSITMQDYFGGYIAGSNVLVENLIEGYLEQVRAFYSKLIEAGVASECARMILPECTKTTLIMTGSIRSWIHFLELRRDEHSQKEAQLIAQEIHQLLSTQLPTIFSISNTNEQRHNLD